MEWADWGGGVGGYLVAYLFPIDFEDSRLGITQAFDNPHPIESARYVYCALPFVVSYVPSPLDCSISMRLHKVCQSLFTLYLVYT